jgi:aspartate racemase
MTLHIGIVGCSAEGAALCYRTICTEGPQSLGPYAHPEVSMHTSSFGEYVTRLNRSDWEGVGELMLASTRKLAALGADFVICPDNTVHQAFCYVEAQSPLPWLHIAEVVADHARAIGARRLGLTGTRWLVSSNVYPESLASRGIEWMRPSQAEREEMSRIIMEELVHGRFEARAVQYFQQVIRNMAADGCDAVVLGCTEIPLIISDANSELRTLDSTRLLARAALKRAIEG